MSICTKVGRMKPFLKITSNISWKEQNSELAEEHTANAGTDIFNRVFRMKTKTMMRDVIDDAIVGTWIVPDTENDDSLISTEIKPQDDSIQLMAHVKRNHKRYFHEQ